jgi:16S rRNA (guanine1207-N2)-methyltransferase
MDYYAFRPFTVAAHGCQVTVCGKPGVWSWDRLDPGTAALLEVAEIGAGDRVLDLGCGTGAIGAVAARQAARGHVTLVDCNVAALACAERTLAANDLANAEVRLGDGVMERAPESFDLVLSHLPRERAVQEELIRGAVWVLRPGGRLYLVASTRAGIKGAIACAREVFGRCAVVRQKKGYHVALATKITPTPSTLLRTGPALPLSGGGGYITRTVSLDGVETVLVSKPGVFAWERLDAGAAALVGAMEIDVGDRVLDLGCGTGLAGLAAARRMLPSPCGGGAGGEVVLVDADVRAVESARRTLAANGVANAEVLTSDCASAVIDRRFDVVITNPPFHQGVGVDYEVAHQFVRDAARVLRRGGRLFLVANRFLRYADLICETFGEVATACADSRYHVLTAVARKSSSG